MCWDLDPAVEVAGNDESTPWVHGLPTRDPPPPTATIRLLESCPPLSRLALKWLAWCVSVWEHWRNLIAKWPRLRFRERVKRERGCVLERERERPGRGERNEGTRGARSFAGVTCRRTS